MEDLLWLDEQLSCSILLPVIVKSNRIIKVDSAIVVVHFQGLLKSTTGIVKIVQLVQCDSQVHVAVWEIWLEVYRRTEVVEGWSILFSVEMNKSKVECCNPLKWIKVQCSLETRDWSNVLLFPEETHADIIPQLSRIWVIYCSNSVLEQGSIMIALVLDNRTRCKNSLGVFRIHSETIA